MADTPAHPHEMQDHLQTYRGFLKGVIMVILISALTLVALSAFAFGKTLPILLGWATLIVGTLAVLIDARSDTKTWRLSLGTLLLFGIITAASI